MFNSNRNRDERASASNGSAAQAGARRGQFSVLGADIVITGNLTATSDLHIDGRIEGDVRCGSLVQGAESQIFGRVEADDARLAGSIEGSVRARQLTVERTARITGDVEYETLTVEQGGHIDGRLKHLGGGSVATGAPVLIEASGEAA